MSDIRFDGPVVEEEKEEVKVAPIAPVAPIPPISPVPPIPKPPKSPEPLKSPVPPEAPFPQISLDTPIRDVLSLNHKGNLLIFDDSPEGFLELEETVLEQLSRENKTRYLVAAGTHARLMKQRKDPEDYQTPGLSITARKASATARLDVKDLAPGMHGFWPLASEVEEFKTLGYEVVHDPKVKTFGGDVSSVRTVSKGGVVEHVLMQIPESVANQRLREIGEKSSNRAKGVEEATKRDIMQSGGIPFDGDKSQGVNWSNVGPRSSDSD